MFCTGSSDNTERGCKEPLIHCRLFPPSPYHLGVDFSPPTPRSSTAERKAEVTAGKGLFGGGNPLKAAVRKAGCRACMALSCAAPAAEPHCLWGGISAGIAGLQVLVLTRAWGQQTPRGSWGHRGPPNSSAVPGSPPAPLKCEANKGPFVRATLSPHGSSLGALNFTPAQLLQQAFPF